MRKQFLLFLLLSPLLIFGQGQPNRQEVHSGAMPPIKPIKLLPLMGFDSAYQTPIKAHQTYSRPLSNPYQTPLMGFDGALMAR